MVALGDDIGDVVDVVDVDNEKTTEATGMDDFKPSFESLFKFFSGSIVIDLVVSDGTFNTDVVVAVLNVTDVFVLKLADFDESGALASFSLDCSALILLVATLSTSSFDSSPRKKLNIIANLDFGSRFLLRLNKVDVFAFGLTNDIAFSSSSSVSFFLLLVAGIAL